MDINPIMDDSTNDLLSPNLQVKAMKRRRVKLGTQDAELEKSTLELLTALRDPPKSKCSNFKPLPAISSNSNVSENLLGGNDSLGDVFLTTLCKTAKYKKSRRKPLELQTNGVPQTTEKCNEKLQQNALPQTTIKIDPSLSHVKPGRRRNNTVEGKEKSFIDQLEDRKKEPDKQRIKSKEFIDEFSFEIKDNSSPRRNSQLPAEKFGATPMRNLKLFDDNRTPDLEEILFQQNKDKDKVVTRSKRKEVQAMLGKSSIETLSFLRSDHAAVDTNSSLQTLEKGIRKHRRNRKFAIDSEFNDSVAEKPVDCESSDVMSVFSDDVTESYDPSMRSNKRNGRRRTSNLNSIAAIKEKTFLLCDEQGDSDVTSGGIFTSPKRHKKRSRRVMCQADHDLFPKESSTLFSLDNETEIGLSDGVESFASTKPNRRRIHNKYLPPLSQNAKKFS